MFINYLKLFKNKVITTVTIPENTVICEFKGNILTFNELNSIENSEVALQIGPNTYISPSGMITDYIRHSCNPNCLVHAVGNRAFLYSIYVIFPNSEITFDYSTTSSEFADTWEMNCNCGSYNCRKKISGFYSLEEKLQKEYKEKLIAALYIRKPIFLRKK